MFPLSVRHVSNRHLLKADRGCSTIIFWAICNLWLDGLLLHPDGVALFLQNVVDWAFGILFCLVQHTVGLPPGFDGP